MKQNLELDERMADAGYVTVVVAEAHTHIHRQTIYDAIKEGKLESKRVGRRHFLEVEAFLDWAGDGARVLWDTSGEA